MPPVKKAPSKKALNKDSSKALSIEVPGFKASGISCGIKKNGRPDLALILSDVPAIVAGVFTRNSVKAAPVVLDMKRVLRRTSRGVVINSGNANACTGRRGDRDAERTASLVEEGLGLSKGDIMVCSTGVIGVPLPVERIRSGRARLIRGLKSGGLLKAARAIMTTDAFPKAASGTARIAGKTVTVAGIAKGAGMICPDMATMLAFLITDAKIKPQALKPALRSAVDISFNSIIVDNDTSTNDTVLLYANGVSPAPEIRPGTPAFKAFSSLLNEVSLKLAHMIVRDGEGATRFIEIDIKGAGSALDAGRAARAVAESMLVKTAFFGGDPNWGRIIAALGRTGIKIREDKVDIAFNGIEVARGGLDTGNEKKAARALKAKEVAVEIDLHAGGYSKKLWTTDLSYDYVRINSAYRT